jgi:hypothetical protein
MPIQGTANSTLFAFTRFVVLVTLAVTLTLAASAFAQLPTKYLSFDAPGAGTGYGQGTFPTSINQDGWVAGTVISSSNVAFGFIRRRDGSFIQVFPPNSSQSFIAAINDSDQVAGSFYGPTATNGFVRSGIEKYTVLAVGGAFATIAAGINDAGVVVGYFYESGGRGSGGFLWSAQNGYTLFEVPGSVPNTTSAFAINGAGSVVGTYEGTDSYSHGFVRSAAGQFTSFELSGGTVAVATAINAAGQVAGYANNADGVFSAFAGNTHGVFATFGVLGAEGTQALAINDDGLIAGYAFNEDCCNESYERDQSGNVTVLPLPFSNMGNQPAGVNSAGDIAGSYTDSAGVGHGWLGLP